MVAISFTFSLGMACMSVCSWVRWLSLLLMVLLMVLPLAWPRRRRAACRCGVCRCCCERRCVGVALAALPVEVDWAPLLPDVVVVPDVAVGLPWRENMCGLKVVAVAPVVMASDGVLALELKRRGVVGWPRREAVAPADADDMVAVVAVAASVARGAMALLLLLLKLVLLVLVFALLLRPSMLSKACCSVTSNSDLGVVAVAVAVVAGKALSGRAVALYAAAVADDNEDGADAVGNSKTFLL